MTSLPIYIIALSCPNPFLYFGRVSRLNVPYLQKQFLIKFEYQNKHSLILNQIIILLLLTYLFCRLRLGGKKILIRNFIQLGVAELQRKNRTTRATYIQVKRNALIYSISIRGLWPTIVSLDGWNKRNNHQHVNIVLKGLITSLYR